MQPCLTLRDLAVAGSQGPADWFAERRSLTEAETVLRALPTTLTELEVDLPPLRPSGCTVKVRIGT